MAKKKLSAFERAKLKKLAAEKNRKKRAAAAKKRRGQAIYVIFVETKLTKAQLLAKKKQLMARKKEVDDELRMVTKMLTYYK